MLGFLYPQADETSSSSSAAASTTTGTTRGSGGGGGGGTEEEDGQAADDAESELVSFYESVGYVEGEGEGDSSGGVGGVALTKDVIMLGEEMEGGEEEGEGMVVEGDEEVDGEGQETLPSSSSYSSAVATTTSSATAASTTTTTTTAVAVAGGALPLPSRAVGARAQKQLAELLDHR